MDLSERVSSESCDATRLPLMWHTGAWCRIPGRCTARMSRAGFCISPISSPTLTKLRLPTESVASSSRPSRCAASSLAGAWRFRENVRRWWRYRVGPARVSRAIAR